MSTMKVSQHLFISCLSAAASVEAAGWGEGLPWEDLSSQLSPTADLVDTGPANFLEECTAEMDRPSFDRSMHALIDQPHGLCMGHMFCAFDACFPNPDASSVTPLERLFTFEGALAANYSTLDPQIRAWIDDVANPAYDLPSKVLFPAVASDVVAAIQFAKTHGLEVSVKNSGHNYNGASTKKDTLHLNMNRYARYAPTGVVDCDPGDLDDAPAGEPGETTPGDALAGQPCRLSLAKNEAAVIRVGGGENWGRCSTGQFRTARIDEGITEGIDSQQCILFCLPHML